MTKVEGPLSPLLQGNFPGLPPLPPKGLAAVPDTWQSALLTPYLTFQELTQEVATHQIGCSRAGMERLKEIDQKRRELMKEASLKIEQQGFWRGVQNISTLIGGSAAIVAGLAMITNPATSLFAAVALIVSGGATLINRVVAETGGWKKVFGLVTESKEIRDRAARFTEVTLVALATSVGLASMVSLYQIGAWAELAQLSSPSLVKKGAEVLDLGATALGFGAGFVRSNAQNDALTLQAKSRLLEGKRTLERLAVSRLARQATELFRRLSPGDFAKTLNALRIT
jgi:hypothetical protein